MAATLIDGKAVAADIRREVAKRAAALQEAHGVTPGLAAVLVGDDPASQVYVRMKDRAAKEAGFHSVTHRLPAETTQEALLARVAALNADPAIHGYIVQLPLPGHIDEQAVLAAVDPGKDVDGFHPENQGRLLSGNPRFAPATPRGVVELLLRSGHDPAGKDVVVVGRSNIVGKPLAALLMNKGDGGNATVTVCHSRTADVAAHTRRADVVVVAIGRPGFLTADMVRPGAVVIDVGVNRVDDPASEKGYRLAGDADTDAVAEVAGAITPVPGGVGPMTIAMLLLNTLEAAEAAAGAEE